MQWAGIQITGKCDGQTQVLGVQSFKESTGVNSHVLWGITFAGKWSVEPWFIWPSVTIQGWNMVSI
jgi:hypothetical protein